MPNVWYMLGALLALSFIIPITLVYTVRILCKTAVDNAHHIAAYFCLLTLLCRECMNKAVQSAQKEKADE